MLGRLIIAEYVTVWEDFPDHLRSCKGRLGGPTPVDRGLDLLRFLDAQVSSHHVSMHTVTTERLPHCSPGACASLIPSYPGREAATQKRFALPFPAVTRDHGMSPCSDPS